MSDPVVLIYAKKTAHLLGAFTRQANASEKVDAATIASPSIIVRRRADPTISVEVLPDDVGAGVGELTGDLLGKPHLYWVQASEDAVTPNELPLPAVKIDGAKVSIDAPGRIKVEIDRDSPLDGDEVVVWAQLERGLYRQTAETVAVFPQNPDGSFTGAAAESILTFGLDPDPGEHQLVILAQYRVPYVANFSV